MYPIYDAHKMYEPSLNVDFNKTILLLGTASNGPILEPILINNIDKMKKIFGTEGNLYKGFLQAYEVSNQIAIYVMRVSGSQAICALEAPILDEDENISVDTALTIKSSYGGEIYNQIKVVIEQHSSSNIYYLKVYYPQELNMTPIAYNLYDFENINELVKIINEDSAKNNTYIWASTSYQDVLISDLISMNSNLNQFLSGGENGIALTKNDLFLALDVAYDLLVGFNANLIVPLEVYIDDFDPTILNENNYYGSFTYNANRDYLKLVDTENNDKFATFHGQLIEFCKNQLDIGIMSHGVISFSLLENINNITDNYIIDWVNSACLQSRYDLTYLNPTGYVDDGQYITVTIGDFTYNKSATNEYRFPWNACYAAMVVASNYNETTTNKNIVTSAASTYDIVNDEIQYLSEIGVVAPRLSVRKGLVVSNGVTAAISTNSLHYLVNVRQVQVAMNELNKNIDYYKGEAIQPLMANNQLQKIIDSTLTMLKNQGLLIDYRFNLEYDKNSSSALIKVDLLTKNMIEYVSTQAQLTLT